MKKDNLSQIWDSQNNDISLDSPDTIIKKAKKQRKGQFITIAVLAVTVAILVLYAITYISNYWNSFTLGLTLMISSLAFRLILEFVTIYRKENQLVLLDNQSFQNYLKKYLRKRLKINYIITPLCFAIYVFGFIMLLPYFKNEFSEGFYTYIIVSGIISLVVVALIVIYSTIKEHSFLKLLNRK